MHKNKLVIEIIVAALFIGVFVYAYIKITEIENSNVAPEAAGAKIVSCDISVHNPFGVPIVRNGDLFIESANCQQQYVKNCGGIFGVFSDIGQLTLSGQGGVGSSISISVGETSSKQATLTWCGTTLARSVKVTLRDDNNNILQTKDVTLQ